MATTAEYLQQLQTDKSNLIIKYNGKGLTLDESATFTDLVNEFDNLPSGGGDLSEYLDNTIVQLAGYANTYSAGIARKIKKIDKSILGEDAITSLQYAFSNLTNLEEINYSGVNIDNVDSLAYTCYNCYKLKKHDLSNHTFSNVLSLTYMHNNNRALTELNLTNTQFPNVTTLSSMCYYCSSLQSLDEIDASKVSSIAGVVSYCTSLTTLGGFKDLGKGYPSFASANSNSYKLDLSTCNALTYDSLMNVINKLYDLNVTFNVAGGGTLKTQQLVLGSTNLAKLTSDEIAIATNKGWTVS